METITSHGPGRIERERRELLAQVKALPPGLEALKKLAFVRLEYDWAVEDYRHSLNILSDTTYQDRKHFLLELIQNADDAQFIDKEATLKFVILDNSIELYYNEKGFEVDNVIAITGTGSSTKRNKHRSSNSFIGEKGIGFKSVFALATDVEIESPPWHFQLAKERCIVPEPLSGGALLQGAGTRLKVRFADPAMVNLVAEELNRYVSGQVESFLFLQRLSRFEVEDRRSAGVVLKGLSLEPADRAGKTLTLETFPAQTTRQYLLYSEDIQFSADLVKERWEKLDLDSEALTRKVVVAALVETDSGVLPFGRLYCYLPTEVKLPVPIYLQVDGHTKADRERLHDPEHNRWNRHLLKSLPAILQRAILDWRNEPQVADRLPNFIPTNPGTDQLGPIFAELMKELESIPWIHTFDERDPWVSPKYALRADKEWNILFSQYPDFRRQAEEHLGIKFVHPHWCANGVWFEHWKCYKVPLLSDVQISELIRYVPLPKELLKEEILFSSLYKQLLNLQRFSSLRYPTESQKVKENLLCAPIFPLEGGELGPLKRKSDDQVFWIAGRSRRTTGLEGSDGAAARIVNVEYTYRSEASAEASAERVADVKRINERNTLVRELLTKLQVSELNDETVLAQLQIPWLLNPIHYSKKDSERAFIVLGAIFEAYRAKRTLEEDYLNQLSKLENASFLSQKAKREYLKDLLLPPVLRIKSEESLYSAGQEYSSLALPESFLEPPPSEAKQVSSEREQERKRKLLEDWRQFLIHCGIKGKPRFIFTIGKYKPLDFGRTDSIRANLWKKHINMDYTSQNPVEVITVQLDAGTQYVLISDDYDKKMMAESLYSTWMESFGKQSLNLDNNFYYRGNPPAGYFITRYRRHENRSPAIKDHTWGGVNRKFIPIQTVTGAATTAILGLRVPTEHLTVCHSMAKYLPLVAESTVSGRGYHSVYLNSLNVRSPRVSNINALWGQVDEAKYLDIIKIALEFNALGISLVGLELYDYEQGRLRPAKDFHLGLEGAKGSALIEKQYGQEGQSLGKILGLTAETDANLFLGLFAQILDGVIDDLEAGKQVYRLLKYWIDWEPTSRGLIAGDLREALKRRDIANPPVIVCNNSKLLSLFSEAKLRAIVLDIKPEEQYQIEKAAKELGLLLPGESGKLVCTGEQSLSERERYRFNQLVKGFLELLEVYEAARLTSMLAGFGTPEEWETHVVKVEAAERRFSENSDLAIPLQLPYLEDMSRLYGALSDPPEEILAQLLSLCEFTTYRHALRDLKDIRVIDVATPKSVKPPRQGVAHCNNGGSEETDKNSDTKKIEERSVNTTPNDVLKRVEELSEPVASNPMINSFSSSNLPGIEPTKINKETLINEETILDEGTILKQETFFSEANASSRLENADPQNIAKSIQEALMDSRNAQIIDPDFEGWRSGLDPEEEIGLRSVLVKDLAKSLAKGPERHEKQIRQRMKRTKTLPDNVKLVDVVAGDSKEFLTSEYHGQCQICGTVLCLSNGHKWIETFHLLPIGKDNWWGNRPFNILGLCPNCHALARHGGGLDLNNIFSTAKELIEGLALPEEVLEYNGDFYTVLITLNGTNRRLVMSKQHLNHFAALLEASTGEVASTTEVYDNPFDDTVIPASTPAPAPEQAKTTASSIPSAAEEENQGQSISNSSEVEQLIDKIYSLINEEQYNEALIFLVTALTLYPTISAFYVGRGYIHDVRQEEKDALEWYKKALSYEPNEPTALVNATIILQSQGNYAEALTYCNRLIDLDQDNSSVHYLKGTILQELNQYEEAVEGLKRCIALDNENADAYFRLGLLLEEQYQEHKQALEMFDKVIDLTPEFDEVYLYKGDLLYDCNNYQEALASFEKAAQLNSENPYAFLRCGNALNALKRVEDAIQEYGKALKLDPECQPAYFQLAYSYDCNGRFEQAVKCYQKAIELNPQDINALNNLGYTLFKMEKYKEALNYFNQALKIDSEYKLAVINKRNLLEKLEEMNSPLGNTIPLVRRLGRNIPSQIKFLDKVMHPSTIPNILTVVLEELLIYRPDVINNLDSIFTCRQPRFTYDSTKFPGSVKFDKLSNGMYVFSTSNAVRTIRMTYSILDLCGYKKEDLQMIFNVS